MCDEAILTQMSPNNYFTLLPKFVHLMYEDNIKKAADKIMCFTNKDFIASCNQAKNLPEEVLLPLLEHNDVRNHDLEIFEFLLKWHKHHTQRLGKSLQLTLQIFACIRYTQIIPQILTSRIASCNLVDKRILSNAFQFIYSSCNDIYNDSDQKHFSVSIFRKPISSGMLKWHGFDGVSLSRDYPSAVDVGVSGSFDAVPFDKYIVKSAPLKDEIYWFKFTKFSNSLSKLMFVINDASEHGLLSAPISRDSRFTLYIYEIHAFLKVVDSCTNTVTSTFGVTGNNPFSVWICRPARCSKKVTFSFQIN